MKPTATPLLFVLLAASALCLGLASCGSGDDSTAPGGTDAGSTADIGTGLDGTTGTDSGATDSGVDRATGTDGAVTDAGDGGLATLASINHFVIIYMENHSFDNLYGEFPGADGIASLDAGATNVQQLNGPDGGPYATLPPPLLSSAADAAVEPGFQDASLANGPFAIEDYVPADAATRDLHHIFFTEQNQINAGAMNLFVYWSDARGLSMGHYHTMNLPVPNEAKNWTVCDHFYHAAFGGSFLNHQFLIAATAPVWDPNVKPIPAAIVQDPATLSPGSGEGQVWHEPTSGTYYVVNTSFSANSPHPYFTVPSANLVPNLSGPTIGDRLTAANLDWAWYAGGWNDAIAYSADAGVPEGGILPTTGGENFQYHHQPFVYFAKYADGTPERAAHLKDEQEFVAAAAAGNLPAVSFIKPVGINNEHPGYTDVLSGDNHLLSLISKIKSSPNWKDTAIIITYDEHGGFWDHVAPPTSDKFGPGSRVPTIVISPFAKTGYVDHTPYDTTSILATIEKRWSLQPLATRDQNATPMTASFNFAH